MCCKWCVRDKIMKMRKLWQTKANTVYYTISGTMTTIQNANNAVINQKFIAYCWTDCVNHFWRQNTHRRSRKKNRSHASTQKYKRITMSCAHTRSMLLFGLNVPWCSVEFWPRLGRANQTDFFFVENTEKKKCITNDAVIRHLSVGRQ